MSLSLRTSAAISHALIVLAVYLVVWVSPDAGNLTIPLWLADLPVALLLTVFEVPPTLPAQIFLFLTAGSAWWWLLVGSAEGAWRYSQHLAAGIPGASPAVARRPAERTVARVCT